MCKVMKFPKKYIESEEIDIEDMYKEFYTDPENYRIDPKEYEGIQKTSKSIDLIFQR